MAVSGRESDEKKGEITGSSAREGSNFGGGSKVWVGETRRFVLREGDAGPGSLEAWLTLTHSTACWAWPVDVWTSGRVDRGEWELRFANQARRVRHPRTVRDWVICFCWWCGCVMRCAGRGGGASGEPVVGAPVARLEPAACLCEGASPSAGGRRRSRGAEMGAAAHSHRPPTERCTPCATALSLRCC